MDNSGKEKLMPIYRTHSDLNNKVKKKRLEIIKELLQLKLDHDYYNCLCISFGLNPLSPLNLDFTKDVAKRQKLNKLRKDEGKLLI